MVSAMMAAHIPYLKISVLLIFIPFEVELKPLFYTSVLLVLLQGDNCGVRGTQMFQDKAQTAKNGPVLLKGCEYYKNPGGFPIGISNPQGYTEGMQNECLKVRKMAGRARGRQAHAFMAGLLVLGSFIDMATADSFRCGRKVIRTGDSPGDLLQRCGEPRYKDRGYENTRAQGSQKKVRVERWYYKKNSRALEQIVVIHKGRIIAINTGQR